MPYIANYLGVEIFLVTIHGRVLPPFLDVYFCHSRVLLSGIGLQEGLQLMAIGARYESVLPAEFGIML